MRYENVCSLLRTNEYLAKVVAMRWGHLISKNSIEALMMSSLKVFILLVIPVVCCAQCIMKFSDTSLTMAVDEKRDIELIIMNCTRKQNSTFKIHIQHKNNLMVFPDFIESNESIVSTRVKIEVTALDPGETSLYTESPISNFSSHKPAFAKIDIYRNQIIEILSIIIGWTYFFTWTVSFYPQVYENHKRKSVVGLNLDYVVVNITGYATYALFNLGLYYIPAIREQYAERYPFSIMSVLPNDIFFGLHGLVLTLYIGLQCLCYERGDQTISWFGKAFHYAAALVLIIAASLCFSSYILWLDFLYICSYIKLAVTFCKYTPQAVMNYKRQSTEGWSIEAVLLDIVGGICSIVQIFLNIYNYNESWAWLLENPTKLWLGYDVITEFVLTAACMEVLQIRRIWAVSTSPSNTCSCYV
ncbi:hypothetical protein Trydic_g897 [Trypoxylus dichotomus]